jgi:acyl-CoA synthetase (AMP-forming)/AMP-acid ligase II
MAEPADAPDVEELRTALRERLSAYKVPRRIAVIEPAALPMLSTGKPDLRRIVECFDEW